MRLPPQLVFPSISLSVFVILSLDEWTFDGLLQHSVVHSITYRNMGVDWLNA